MVFDADSTRRAISEAHDTKVAQLRALRAQAERELQQAEARFDRVRRAFQNGEIRSDDWAEQREELSGERAAARAEVERHTQQEADLNNEIETIDAEDALVAELAAIRSIVLGQVPDRRQTLDALRAALTRLFDRFVLETHPVVLGPDDDLAAFHVHHTLNVPQPDGDPQMFIRPFVRPEAVRGWDSEEYFPALHRAVLALGQIDGKGWPFSYQSSLPVL